MTGWQPLASGYQSSPSFSWTPAASGSYELTVRARAQGSIATYEAYAPVQSYAVS